MIYQKVEEAAEQLRNYALATQYLLNGEFESREEMDNHIQYLEGLAKALDKVAKDMKDEKISNDQQKILASLDGKPMFSVRYNV